MNARTDYTTLADAVGEALEGQRQAARFLDRLNGEIPDPDALYYEWIKAQGTPARARGFARRLQKDLGRGIADATY